MSETLERLLSRLENLEAIEPLVSSMRILSLSTVQFAINRREFLETYQSEYLQIIAQLEALKKEKPRKAFRWKKPVATGKKLLIVLGSDRGIVGQYNRQLSSMAENWAAENPQGQILSFGMRLISTMRQLLNIPFERGGTLVKGYSPDYERISPMIAEWQQAIDAGDIETVLPRGYR
jgi:F0F1-type ATP synthase gamma subunit